MSSGYEHILAVKNDDVFPFGVHFDRFLQLTDRPIDTRGILTALLQAVRRSVRILPGFLPASVTFLISILTPSFFRSEPCRSELEGLLDREKQLKRNDLILPVYYVNCAVLNEAAKRDTDPLAKAIATRQRADWRELRFVSFTSHSSR